MSFRRRVRLGAVFALVVVTLSGAAAPQPTAGVFHDVEEAGVSVAVSVVAPGPAAEDETAVLQDGATPTPVRRATQTATPGSTATPEATGTHTATPATQTATLGATSTPEATATQTAAPESTATPTATPDTTPVP